MVNRMLIRLARNPAVKYCCHWILTQLGENVLFRRVARGCCQPPAPQERARETFTSSRSSTDKPHYRSRFLNKSSKTLTVVSGRVGHPSYRCGAAPVVVATSISTDHPVTNGFTSPVIQHQPEVCPLSRGANTPIPLITRGHSLPLASSTRTPIGSPCGLLSLWERYGLTTFRGSTNVG